MTGKYASSTSVPVERSRMEIEATLRRYGASAFMAGFDDKRAFLMFEAYSRRVKFVLPMPKLDEFKTNKRGQRRTTQAQNNAHDQEIRRRWRALALAIKAKLEVVASGIGTFEDEFLAHIVLPDGKTVGDWIAPQLQATYDTGKMPPLLPSGE